MGLPVYKNEELDELIDDYAKDPDETNFVNILKYLKQCPVFSCDHFVTAEYMGKTYYHVYTYVDKDMSQSNCYIRTNINDVIEMIESEERETGYKIDHIVVENTEGREFIIDVNKLQKSGVN